MSFKETNIRELNENFVKLIAENYMLITAGDRAGFNTMTASWGGFGEMWGNDVSLIAVRPTRYTFEFLEKSDYYSLCFFSKEAGKKIHAVCGSKSGRDVNKAEAADLTALFTDGTTAFDEAEIIVVCQKVYASNLSPGDFLDASIEKWYKDDYHKIYVGNILKVYVKE